jgi:hypothetical protein
LITRSGSSPGPILLNGINQSGADVGFWETIAARGLIFSAIFTMSALSEKGGAKKVSKEGG